VRFRGPVAWVNIGEQGVPESGFYALTRDGKALARPLRRLVAVQHRLNSKHHYRDARPDEHSPPVGRVIELEYDGQGKGNVAA
jgi:hypothetical protein